MLTRFDLTKRNDGGWPGWKRIEEEMPAAGESVLYRTGDHQALGVYEGDNRWRCSNGQVEDAQVLLWQPFYSF